MEHAQSDEHFHGNFEKELQNKYNFQSLKTNWHNMNTNNMTQYCARLEPSPISLYFLRKCEMGAGVY